MTHTCKRLGALRTMFKILMRGDEGLMINVKGMAASDWSSVGSGVSQQIRSVVLKLIMLLVKKMICTDLQKEAIT